MKIRSNGVVTSDSSIKLYTDLLIESSSWVSDSEYDEYPYKATLACSKITEKDYLDMDIDYSGDKLAPFVMTSENVITFYASSAITEDITVNRILAFTISYSENGTDITV